MQGRKQEKGSGVVLTSQARDRGKKKGRESFCRLLRPRLHSGDGSEKVPGTNARKLSRKSFDAKLFA